MTVCGSWPRSVRRGVSTRLTEQARGVADTATLSISEREAPSKFLLCYKLPVGVLFITATQPPVSSRRYVQAELAAAERAKAGAAREIPIAFGRASIGIVSG
jgi:hypothetical protein